MLKARYENKDAIPEGLQDHYAENTDGSYSLGVEGLVDKSKVNEFRTSNIELNKKNAALEAKYSGIDLDAAQNALLELEKQKNQKVLDENGVDVLLEQRTEQMRQDHKKQIEQLTQAQQEIAATLDRKNQEFSKLAINNSVAKAAAQLGVRNDKNGGESVLQDIILNANQVFRHENGKITPYDSEGNVIYNKQGTEPQTVTEWLDSQQDTRFYWWGDNVSGHAAGGKAFASQNSISKEDLESGNFDIKKLQEGKLNFQ